jgi:hypothetical protein
MLGAIIGCTRRRLRRTVAERLLPELSVPCGALLLMPAPESVEEQLHHLLVGESPAVAALVHRLRAVVRTAHPDLRERVYPGWHGLGFRHPRAGYLCALFPRDGGVNVGFEHGADLPDPHGRLLGDGRRMRDVRVEVTAGPDEDEVVVDYLDLALDWALDRTAGNHARAR